MIVPTLQGARVRLRRAHSADVADRLANGRHAEIVRSYGGDTSSVEPLTPQQAEAWLRQE